MAALPRAKAHLLLSANRQPLPADTSDHE